MDYKQVKNKIIATNSQGQDVRLVQTIKMTDKVDENGKLISVKNGESEIANLSKKNGDYFLNLQGVNLKNSLGDELTIEQFKILSDKNNPPITLGTGLQDELIVSISLNGEKGRAKITPTMVSVTFEDGTIFHSTPEDGKCFDMEVSASVVEEMYSKSNTYFSSPVILGKGIKAPTYLLGMYALNEIEENTLVNISDNIGAFRIDTGNTPMVFFTQKTAKGTSLYIYNNGIPKKIDSYFFSRDDKGNTFITLQTSTGNLKYNIPLNANCGNEEMADLSKNDILQLFNGLSIKESGSTDKKASKFAIPKDAVKISQSAPIMNEYTLSFKPMTGKLDNEIPFSVVKFENDDKIYYVNRNVKRVFVISNGRVEWQKFENFDKFPQEVGGQVFIKKSLNGLLFLVGNDENGDDKIGQIINEDGSHVVKMITNEQYNQLTTNNENEDVSPQQQEGDAPSNFVQQNQPEQNQHNETQPDESKVEEAMPVNTEEIAPPASEPAIEETLTNDEKSTEDESSTADKTASENQKPNGKPDAPQQSSPAPEKKKVDLKKKVETISTIATTLGLFMILVGAIFAPWLALVGIVATTTSGLTYTFSSAFKFDAYRSVKSKIKQAEQSEKNGISREKENEAFIEKDNGAFIEKDNGAFIEKDNEFDTACASAEKASKTLSRLSEIENTPASMFADLCNSHGPSYLTSPDGKMDFNSLIDQNNLDGLAYRMGLVEQIDEIARTKDLNLKGELINNFFSSNFKNVSAEERKKYSSIFVNNGSLTQLRRGLNDLNAEQQQMQNILKEKREYFTDKTHGEERILSTIKSLPETEQVNFFNRYGEAIAYSLSQNTNMTTKVQEILSAVKEENREKIEKVLSNAESRLSFDIGDNLTNIAQEHHENIKNIDAFKDFAEILTLAEKEKTEHEESKNTPEKIEETTSEETSKTSDGVRRYTDSFMNQIHLRYKDKYLPNFNDKDFNKKSLDKDFKLFTAFKAATIDKDLTTAIETLENACKKANIASEINEIAKNSSLFSMLPSPTDNKFERNKLFYSFAYSLAQNKLMQLKTSYDFKDDGKIEDRTFAMPGDQGKTLDNNDAEKIRNEKTNAEEIIDAFKNFNKKMKAQAESIEGIIDISEKHINKQSKIDETDIQEELKKEEFEKLKNTLDNIRSGKDKKISVEQYTEKITDDLKTIATARIIAKGKIETETNATKIKLYTEILKTINLGLVDQLPFLRVSNSYVEVNKTDLNSLASTPKEALKTTQTETDKKSLQNNPIKIGLEKIKNLIQDKQKENPTSGFNNKFNSFLATLTETQRDEIKNKIKEKNISQIEALKSVVGEQVLTVCGKTFNELIEKYTKDDSIDIKALNSQIVELRKSESARVATQMLFTETRTAGIGQINDETLRDTLIEKRNTLNGIKRTYADVIEWIVKTQGVKREIVLREYSKIKAQHGDMTNSGITEELFEKLNLSNDTLKAFKKDQRNIKNLRLDQSVSLFELEKGEKSRLEEEIAELDEDNNKEYEFVNLMGKMCDEKIADNEVYRELMAFMNAGDGNSILNKCNLLFDDIGGDAEDTIKFFNKAFLNKDLKRKIREKFVKLSESEDYLNFLKGVGDDKEALDSNSPLGIEMAILKIKQKKYQQTAEKFNKIYEEFAQAPTDEDKQKQLKELIEKANHDEFFKLSGISQQSIKRLVEDCVQAPEFAKQIVATFNNQNNIEISIARADEKFISKQEYLKQVSLASSQEEIDVIDQNRQFELFEDGCGLFNKKVEAINKLPAKDDQIQAMDAILKYYRLLIATNKLENLEQKPPTPSLYNNFNDLDNIIKVKEKTEKLLDETKQQLEYLNFPLEIFDAESDRIVAGELNLSQFDTTEQEDIPPIDPTLKGKAKKKAIAKRNKLIAKRNAKIMKNFKSMKIGIEETQQEKAKDLKKKQAEVQISSKAKASIPQTKSGLFVLGKILDGMALQRERDAQKTKEKQAVKEGNTQEKQTEIKETSSQANNNADTARE